MLVERTDAMDLLDGLLAAAVAGKGRVAIVTGAVATGKTELLHTFADRVLDLNGLAITATGSRVEQDVPLGVMSQLLLDAPLVDGERRRTMNLLHEGTQSLLRGSGPARLDQQIVHALCGVLLELSRRYPLAIVVDDLDRTDPASLICLAYLARRARFAPMLVVFSHAGQRRAGEQFLELEELGRSPYGAHIPLVTLSAAGVRELAEIAAVEDADRFTDAWHGLSGGNPLLLGGLIEDHRQAIAAGAAPDTEPAAGGHYAEAVLACLRRVDGRSRRVAGVIAVRPDDGSLSELAQLDPAHVAQAVRALTAAGLLRRGDFAHPVARAAVLSGMDAAERADLHQRAARIAYHDGAPSQVVAEHLVQADRTDDPWAVPVLEDAARQVLRDGRVVTAVGYLKLAWQACADDQHRSHIMTTMLRAGWRINPSVSAGYLPELSAALQNGFLSGGDALVLVQALLWNGQFEDAAAAFRHLGDREHDQETLVELAVTRPQLRVTYPGLAVPPGDAGPPNLAAMTTVSDGQRLKAAGALATVLTEGPSTALVGTVERILRNARLDEMSLSTVESALLALIYAGKCEQAAPWCDRFIEEARERRASSRLARLAAIRAEIALRTGDLPGAAQHARLALATMPPNSWGVAVGGPVATLVRAATAMGDYDTVREQLDLPVPEEMFQTRYGLHYLHARGHYRLAIGEVGYALRDFELCGELMSGWQLDVPGLIAWRVDAADALLRLKRPCAARKLVDDQLARCGKDMPRVHGMAMRVFAALGEVRHRPMLLRQAADLLSGDEYEMTLALTDLMEAYHMLGESRRAGMIARSARALAAEVGAQPLVDALSRDDGDSSAPPANSATGAAALSHAERRVAELAAEGFTNREIAAKLYITVSTVEQHLTRTYRKLNVTRRSDLPPNLALGFGPGVPIRTAVAAPPGGSRPEPRR